MNCTHTPEVLAGWKVIDPLDQRIRQNEVVGTTDALSEEHADGPGKIWVVINVDVVAGNLRVRGVGPVEQSRYCYGCATYWRERRGRRRHWRGVHNMHDQGRRGEASDIVCRHSANTVVDVRDFVSPSCVELCSKLNQ